MKVFLLDLWLDLREKRLAWLAIALLAAVVLVPVFLWKGADEQPVPQAQTAQTGKLPLEAVVKSDDQVGPVDSKLESFSPRDPFEPKGGRVVAGSGGGEAATGTTGSTGATTGTTTDTTGTTGGGVTTGEPGTTGGGTTGGGTTGGGTTGGGTTPRRTFYTYTTNLRFGPTDELKRMRGVKRLELIPSEDDPKLVFLGVTTTAKTAVFLVDSSLGVDSEGVCRPSRDECTFLYLRPDDDHDTATLTDADGNTFEVVLDRINRVVISSGGGSTGSGDGNRSGESDRSPAFTGSAKSGKSSDSAPESEPPPGERSAPFMYRGFFGDESNK